MHAPNMSGTCMWGVHAACVHEAKEFSFSGWAPKWLYLTYIVHVGVTEEALHGIAPLCLGYQQNAQNIIGWMCDSSLSKAWLPN